MNISGFLAIIVISVLVSTAGQQVYAQYGGAPTTSTANDYKVTINSDKSSYAIGETITLSGNVSKYEENRTLQITIFDSANKLVLSTEIPVTANGKFSYAISNNEKFSKVGEYTLRAQYGKTHLKVEKLSFTLVADTKKMADAKKVDDKKNCSDLSKGAQLIGCDNAGLILESSAFKNGKQIPKKYGYKNSNINPPLTIKGIPQNAKSLVLIMDDPDAMGAVGKIWVHWVIWNIEPKTKEIKEDSIPTGSIEGTTDFGSIGYGGPAPPDKEHTYIFKLYALDSKLNLAKGASKTDVEKSMKNHILAETKLTGKYAP